MLCLGEWPTHPNSFVLSEHCKRPWIGTSPDLIFQAERLLALRETERAGQCQGFAGNSAGFSVAFSFSKTLLAEDSGFVPKTKELKSKPPAQRIAKVEENSRQAVQMHRANLWGANLLSLKPGGRHLLQACVWYVWVSDHSFASAPLAWFPFGI